MYELRTFLSNNPLRKRFLASSADNAGKVVSKGECDGFQRRSGVLEHIQVFGFLLAAARPPFWDSAFLFIVLRKD